MEGTPRWVEHEATRPASANAQGAGRRRLGPGECEYYSTPNSTRPDIPPGGATSCRDPFARRGAPCQGVFIGAPCPDHGGDPAIATRPNTLLRRHLVPIPQPSFLAPLGGEGSGVRGSGVPWAACPPVPSSRRLKPRTTRRASRRKQVGRFRKPGRLAGGGLGEIGGVASLLQLRRVREGRPSLDRASEPTYSRGSQIRGTTRMAFHQEFRSSPYLGNALVSIADSRRMPFSRLFDSNRSGKPCQRYSTRR
jgi:hypothetical protein